MISPLGIPNAGPVDWNTVRRYSVMPIDRLLVLREQAKLAASIAGQAAELGSYLGGSAILISQVLPHKRLHAFESFLGLSNLCSLDCVRVNQSDRGHAPGDFRLASAEEQAGVRSRLAAHGIVLHEGLFSSGQRAIAAETFCFAHFDGDTYHSAREFLEFFCPRLEPGGRLLFDDVYWPATPGVLHALRDYFVDLGRLHILPTCQAVYVKEAD